MVGMRRHCPGGGASAYALTLVVVSEQALQSRHADDGEVAAHLVELGGGGGHRYVRRRPLLRLPHAPKRVPYRCRMRAENKGQKG